MGWDEGRDGVSPLPVGCSLFPWCQAVHLLWVSLPPPLLALRQLFFFFFFLEEPSSQKQRKGRSQCSKRQQGVLLRHYVGHISVIFAVNMSLSAAMRSVKLWPGECCSREVPLKSCGMPGRSRWRDGWRRSAINLGQCEKTSEINKENAHLKHWKFYRLNKRFCKVVLKKEI